MRAYLDNAASTPLRDGVLEAMLPYLSNEFGNPSGAHEESRQARKAIDEARDSIARLVGAEPHDVIFTSGGTESNNLAVRGLGSGEVFCSAIEHEAILEPVKAVGGKTVAVDCSGQLEVAALRTALEESPSALVSVMTANNETGVIQPMDEIVRVTREFDSILHSDAVQAAPWIDLTNSLSGVDSFSISAHKFGGPKGVGALIVRKKQKLTAQQLGGGQEEERRSGTQNVAGIVGMAAALEISCRERGETNKRVAQLRDELLESVLKNDGVERSSDAPVLPNNAHVLIDDIESEALVALLDDYGIACSAASACASGAMQPSHVLIAMGYSKEQSRSSLRLTLGYQTTADQIELASKAVKEAVLALRSGNGSKR